jgi:hypothetical protein
VRALAVAIDKLERIRDLLRQAIAALDEIK